MTYENQYFQAFAWNCNNRSTLCLLIYFCVSKTFKLNIWLPVKQKQLLHWQLKYTRLQVNLFIWSYLVKLLEVKKYTFILVFRQTVSRILTNEASWLFSSWFWPLSKRVSIFEAAWAVVEIGLSLEPNHHYEFEPSYLVKNSKSVICTI